MPSMLRTTVPNRRRCVRMFKGTSWNRCLVELVPSGSEAPLPDRLSITAAAGAGPQHAPRPACEVLHQAQPGCPARVGASTSSGGGRVRRVLRYRMWPTQQAGLASR